MKRCEDCKFAQTYAMNQELSCGHTDVIIRSPVRRSWDRVLSCEEARQELGVCGAVGNKYEPKDSVE